MNKCGVTRAAAVAPCHDAFELVQAGKRPLNLPPSLESMQRAAVLASRLDPVLAVRRKQFSAALWQLLIERLLSSARSPTSRRDRPTVTISSRVASTRVTKQGLAEAVCTQKSAGTIGNQRVGIDPITRKAACTSRNNRAIGQAPQA